MIILIDNYDSFTYNLVHYFQEIGEKVKVYRNDEKESDFFIKEKPKFLVISPGPSSPRNAGICLELIKKNSELKYPIPTLGVCLGHQAIAEAFGGTLRNLKKVYHGVSSKIKVTDSDLIFDNIESELEVGRYHSWIVDKPIPNDFKVTSIDENGEIMSIKHKDYNVRGVQFHPESVLTPKGKIILKNWINSL